MVVQAKPTIISALGAVLKKAGGVRIIHDASRPEGQSLNSFASIENKLTFETIANAEMMIQPGWYMAKLDLKAAYRSVLLHPSQYHLTGLKWTFSGHKSGTYLVDTRLPFGARFSPGIFHNLTQAVKVIMAAKGFKGLVVYLDDFLVIEPTKERCAESLSTLIQLVRKLGFSIAWDKVTGPTRMLTFLGVELDTSTMEMRLPNDKLIEFKTLLDTFLARSRCSLRQCQELAGKMNWALNVVRAGRIYLRRFFEVMQSMKARHHKIILSAELRADIEWWQIMLSNFNGVRLLQPDGPVNVTYVQASAMGMGMVCEADWYYLCWHSDFPMMENIGWVDKEVAAMAITLLNWGHKWTNSTVILCSRYRSAVNNFLRGTVRYTPVRALISLALMWTAHFNIRLKVQTAAVQTFDKVNCVANLCEPGQLWALESHFGYVQLNTLKYSAWMLLSKMSLTAFYGLFPQVERWWLVKQSWLERWRTSEPNLLPMQPRRAILHT